MTHRPSSLPQFPAGALRGWKERLDARISRCPGCDQWCWDGLCHECIPADVRESIAALIAPQRKDVEA